MTLKEIALEKLQLEINNDIDLAIDLAKGSGLLEFLYFIYQLHWVRLLHRFENAENENPEILNVYANSTEESFKYIASLIAKFGNWKFVLPKDEKISYLNSELVQVFLKHVNLINSKNETGSLVQLFDVQTSGERNQHFKIDMSNVKSDQDVKKLFDYFLRIDDDNDVKKNSKRSKEELFQNFKEEYMPFSDLFEQELGISIDEFCWLIDQLLSKVIDTLKTKEHLLVKLANGNIDVTNQITFLHFSYCFLHDKPKFLMGLHSKFHAVIKRLIFNPELFDERQLRFHQVTRQPLFEHGNVLIISPELILDSMFTNIHFSLIEASNIKNEYIARQASMFLDKLAKVANQYGYFEVEREKDLFEGRNQIGDIDIIFKNEVGNYLLIEAKNHALPMDVYFKDVLKTKEHLSYLQDEWERKVLRRVEHLKLHHENYSIPHEYQYIVVSRFPEIISHYSNLLILSIQEFEIWLEKFSGLKDFNDFYDQYYETMDSKFTVEEMEEMQKANLFFGRFAKE